MLPGLRVAIDFHSSTSLIRSPSLRAARSFIDNFTLTPIEPFFWPSAGSLGDATGGLVEPIAHFVTGEGNQAVGFDVNTASIFAQYRYTPHIQSKPNGGGVYLFEEVWSQFKF